jgi:tetratricopeptide (TPR) repeat protein
MPETMQPPASKPDTIEEILSLGWSEYASGQFEAAEKTFRKVLDQSADAIEAYYGLGLSLKAQDRREETIRAFQKVVDLLEKDQAVDRVRKTMLRRLALGHINVLRQGDWNLEKEIWQKR